MSNCAILDFSKTIAAVDERSVFERIYQTTGLGIELLKEMLVNPALMKENQEHLDACKSIIADEIERAEPIPGVKEAMEAMILRGYSIVISSNGLQEAIKKWLEKNDLDKYVYLVYGLEDGNKNRHLESLVRIEEPYDWLFIGNSPKDFLQIAGWCFRKVAVNANPEESYPKDVRVFYEPLSAKLVERIAIGG
jgi:phosphoglycolate phosphatase-like HAD superfamily hydrolase